MSPITIDSGPLPKDGRVDVLIDYPAGAINGRRIVQPTGERPPDTITVATGPGFRSPPPHRKSAGTPVKPYRPSHNRPHQGAKERARRLRQAERAKRKAVR